MFKDERAWETRTRTSSLFFIDFYTNFSREKNGLSWSECQRSPLMCFCDKNLRSKEGKIQGRNFLRNDQEWRTQNFFVKKFWWVFFWIKCHENSRFLMRILQEMILQKKTNLPTKDFLAKLIFYFSPLTGINDINQNFQSFQNQFFLLNNFI